MELCVFTAVFSAIFFFIGWQPLYAVNLFIGSATKFIIVILTYLFPFIGLFVAVMLVCSFYKKDYYKYFKIIFVSFLLFFVGFINFIFQIKGERIDFISFLISVILLVSLKEKNIKYIGVVFVMILSVLMRYYYLF